MSHKNETMVLVLSLFITLVLVGIGIWSFTNNSKIFEVSTAPGRLEERISLGDKILVMADTNPDKQTGVEAFAKGDFSTAITQLQSSLQKNRNDPEALIYLNNAKASNSNALKIAVSVPIGDNLNIAKEMLRGVAQAQDEVNKSGGINGTLLKVEIANDDNDPNVVKQIASEFVKDSNILAVVGHNSSDASIAAASVYQQAKLVMITPTSTAKNLSGIGSYIFRTVPSIRFEADTLSHYAIKTARLNKIAICGDSQAASSQSLKEEFISAVYDEGGKVSRINCDFSAPNFNPSTAISQAISDGADGLLLASSVGRINRAIEVAQANKRLSLLGGSTLYTYETLQKGQADVSRMVLAVAWHPAAIPENPFPSNAVKLWGGSVNWRTAMAYDATQAIVTGLKQNQSRDGLQKVFSSPNFSADGATGKIQFLSSGDRNGAAILVRIQPEQSSGTGYSFVPLSR